MTPWFPILLYMIGFGLIVTHTDWFTTLGVFFIAWAVRAEESLIRKGKR